MFCVRGQRDLGVGGEAGSKHHASFHCRPNMHFYLVFILRAFTLPVSITWLRFGLTDEKQMFGVVFLNSDLPLSRTLSVTPTYIHTQIYGQIISVRSANQDDLIGACRRTHKGTNNTKCIVFNKTTWLRKWGFP